MAIGTIVSPSTLVPDDHTLPDLLFRRSLFPIICSHRNVSMVLVILDGTVFETSCSAIALNVRTEIDCQALYTFNQVFGNAAIGLASINLSIRT